MATQNFPDSSIPQTAEISVEHFLLYYNMAYQRDNIAALNQLCNRYPIAAELAFDNKRMNSRHTSDDYADCCFPVLTDTMRLTERYVLNVVSYLLGTLHLPKTYRLYLQRNISYQEIFNYAIDRFQRDYDPEALWNDFFMVLPDLRKIIELRRIRDFYELTYRASEYFSCAYAPCRRLRLSYNSRPMI